MDTTERDALRNATERLLAHREGTLHFEEHFVPTPFVTDPASGRLVMPVPEAAFFAPEHIFFVPEEAQDALQLLLSVERAEESALTDRWMAHHGEPEHVRWAECYIDAAKRQPWVFDGDALMLTNPLAGDEPWIVRTLNEDEPHVRRVVSAIVEKEATEAQVVAVDDLGAHVRARFGVVRATFPERGAGRDRGGGPLPPPGGAPGPGPH
ncbi:MAG: hypothetical protein AAGH64_01770, partial [Planctomycetota bacterium]